MTNESARILVRGLIGPQEPLITIVKRENMKLFGHVVRKVVRWYFKATLRVADALVKRGKAVRQT